VHAARVLLRNLLVLAHQAVVLVPVFLVFGLRPGWGVAPGLALWVVDGFFLVLALGALSARFRDIPPIVASAMQLAFFVTPVIWRVDQLGPGHGWVAANPLAALIGVLRTPFLGQDVPGGAWPVALGTSLALVLAGAAVFAHARARLAFWL